MTHCPVVDLRKELCIQQTINGAAKDRQKKLKMIEGKQLCCCSFIARGKNTISSSAKLSCCK